MKQLELFDQSNNEPDAKSEVVQFFERMDTETLERWVKQYNHLLDIEFYRAPPKVHPITKKTIEPCRMPWMIPAWSTGLKIATDILNNRK